MKMLNLPNYQETNQIYTGSKTLVYRAIRARDRQPLIVKVLRNPHPNVNELVKFRNQYLLTRELEHPLLVQPLALEDYGNGYALVMKDEGEIPLGEYWQESPRYLKEFLAIAMQLSEVLHYLSQKRIIHKDIKPSNILIHPETGLVKLIDFSISSVLPKEQQQLINPNLLEGTLAYISPEQTGRMNRGIDYRTDFYSLGVTFFELLTGSLPFTTSDPMELVHCHLAQAVAFPSSSGQSEVPEMIKKIVLKLMAKNAEERYQSALGLKHDLERCGQQLQATGEINLFQLGERDLCDRFLIPEKLYGREKQVQTLLDAFQRVGDGSTEMILVAGFSGIGKTAVVNEVHKPIVKQRGYFIKGKFDQFNRNIPFSAFVQAFRDLMGQLLGESDVELTHWRAKILAAVGECGQVITEVIPELEVIVGKQPPVPELEGSAAQNRFNLLFGKFVRVFTTKEHPLVIFLDDLQWADSASLNLLKLLMGESEAGYLLVLGAYRDNEVFPAHPLLLTLSELEKNQAVIATITLQPLVLDHINRLVAETLSCSRELAQPLTKLVYQKTQGNPFFTTQFLRGLYGDELIQFNRDSGYWQWDLVKVRNAALTDNVVEFMAERLQKLPEATQDILKLAACIGNQFELKTLTVVCEECQENVAAKIWEALQEGLIVPISEAYKFFQDAREEKTAKSVTVGYRFLHDRVQQAAYSLIAESRKQSVHLKIGQLLLANQSPADQEDNIFNIVNHLVMGSESDPSAIPADQLAELAFSAGMKAKLSVAYQAAIDYFSIGLERLPLDAWNTHYRLMVDLNREKAECHYLVGQFEESESILNQTLKHVQETLDAARIYGLLMTQRMTEGKNPSSSVAAGIKGLAVLGMTLPTEGDALESLVATEMQQVQQAFDGMSPQSLVDLPPMTDPIQQSCMKLLTILWSASYLAGNPNLNLLTTLRMMNLSLKHGRAKSSSFAYCSYGVVLAYQGNYRLGYQFGRAALDIDRKFHNVQFLAKNNNHFGHAINAYIRPLAENLPLYQQSFEICTELGDLVFGVWAIAFSIWVHLLKGTPLPQIAEQIQQYMGYVEGVNDQNMLYAFQLKQQFVAELMDDSAENGLLTYQGFRENPTLKLWQQSQYDHGINWYGFLLLQRLYLKENYEQAVQVAQSLPPTLPANFGFLPIIIYHLYYPLSLTAVYSEVDPATQASYWQQLQEQQQLLQTWSETCPETFLHKYQLISAEIAHLNGDRFEAVDLYDSAIAGAKANGFIQEEALANELAAKFYLYWGKQTIAASYMQEAYYCYVRWGAKAKIDHLQQTYPQLLTEIGQPSAPFPSASNLQTFTPSLSSNTFNTSVLDLTSAIKASQALSQEIELDALLKKIMHIILENAGADTVALILDNSGIWELVAQCDNKNCYIFTTPLDQADTIPHTIINTVKRTQQSLLINNLQQDQTFTSDPYLIQKQPKSLFCTSILNQGQLLGILYLENNLTTEAFTSDHIEVLKLLTTQAAISIKNARFYQTLETKVAERTTQLAAANAEIIQLNNKLQTENLRLGAELDVARQIQQMILPKPEELEEIKGLDIAGFMEPADEVGGDYYDVLETDGIVTVGIGDVTGHGLESGLLMLMTQTAVCTLQEIREQDPVRFLDTLNRTIYRNVQRMNSDKNLTLAILNYSEGRVSITGQHEETLLVRAGGHIERIDTMDLGLPIGLDDDIADFIDHTIVELHPGDGVVVYTDGIPEAFNLKKKQYGMERLCEIISQNWQHNAQEIKQAVIDDLRAFIGGQKIFDDITLVILKQQ